MANIAEWPISDWQPAVRFLAPSIKADGSDRYW